VDLDRQSSRSFILIELAQNDAKFLVAAQALKNLSTDTRQGLLKKYLDLNMQGHVNDAINDAVICGN
jgi:hypothetical protein